MKKIKILMLITLISFGLLTAQETIQPTVGLGASLGGFTSLTKSAIAGGDFANIYVKYNLEKLNISLGYNTTNYNKIIDEDTNFKYAKGYSGVMFGVGYYFYRNIESKIMMETELIGVNAFKDFVKFDNYSADLLLKAHIAGFYFGAGVGYLHNNIPVYYTSALNNMTFSLRLGISDFWFGRKKQD